MPKGKQMAAGNDTWLIKRGDTFFKEYQIFTGNDPQKLILKQDLTDLEITGMMRLTPNGVVILNLNESGKELLTVTNAKDGLFQIKIPPSKTAALGSSGQEHTFYGDIQVKEKKPTAPGEEKDVETIMNIAVTVVDDYTHAAPSGF